MNNKESKSLKAEKRLLWEVRQRYNIKKPAEINKTITSQRPKNDSSMPSSYRPIAGIKPGLSGPTIRVRGVRRANRSRTSLTGRWVRRAILSSVLLICFLGGVFGYKILSASNKISTAERSVLGQLQDLLFSQGKVLSGEADGRVNIMLSAIGGEGHRGENLADTVMIASLDLSNNAVALLSIPRDLYVQVPEEDYYTKLNAIHAYGESIKKGQGPILLEQTIESVTGLPIHYYGRVDFVSFKQIVDAVGGVDITINNSFFDYWHKIAFSSGSETMDGERALAYVRARYIEGPEGGDFKRAERQQQILLSLREKIFSVNTALDFSALNTIINSLSDNIRTDMQLWEMKRFYEIARQLNPDQVKSVVLTTGPSGLLVGTTEILGETPASVLKTRTGDYSEIQALAANIFTEGHTFIASAAPQSPELSPTPNVKNDTVAAVEKPTIEIRNGTNITGLAKSISERYKSKDYKIVSIGNAATRGQTKTIVYILDDSFTAGAKIVAESLSAATDSGLPIEETSSAAQILIILGEDAT